MQLTPHSRLPAEPRYHMMSFYFRLLQRGFDQESKSSKSVEDNESMTHVLGVTMLAVARSCCGSQNTFQRVHHSLRVDPLFKRREGLRKNEQSPVTVSSTFLELSLAAFVQTFQRAHHSLRVDPLFKRRRGLRNNEQSLVTVSSTFLELSLAAFVETFQRAHHSLRADPLFKRRKGLRNNEQNLVTVSSTF